METVAIVKSIVGTGAVVALIATICVIRHKIEQRNERRKHQ